MKLSSLLLCEKAIVRENLLHILGGGARSLTRLSLPAPLMVDVAIVLQPDSVEDLVRPHRLKVIVGAENGGNLAVAEISIQIALPGETPQILPGVPITVPLQTVGATAYGLHHIEVFVDGDRLGSIDFIVEKELTPGFTDSLGGTH